MHTLIYTPKLSLQVPSHILNDSILMIVIYWKCERDWCNFITELQLLPESLSTVSSVDKNQVSPLFIFEIVFTSQKYKVYEFLFIPVTA